MARVKRSVASRKRRKKVLAAAKGYVGTRHSRYKVANEPSSTRSSTRTATGRAASATCGGCGSSASTPPLVPKGFRTTSSSPGCRKAGDRARPQGARRARGRGSGGVRRDRRAREVRARSRQPELATSFWTRRPSVRAVLGSTKSCCRLRGRSCRGGARRAGSGLGRAAAPGRPGCTFSFSAVRRPGTTRSRSIATSCGEFVATQGVQTNEVQRSWVLLPLLLRVAQRIEAEAFDLVELGPSAGLNLVWDRYRYRYRPGSGGGRTRCCASRARSAVRFRATCSSSSRRCARRIGIDRSPIDVTTDDGARLLRSFVWAGQDDRMRRLDQAIDAVRADPPELVRGDYVEALPEVLAAQPTDGLTIVFQTASFGYIGDEGRARVRAVLEEAGANRQLAFISTGKPRGRGRLGPEDRLLARRGARVRRPRRLPRFMAQVGAVITSAHNPKLRLIHRLLESRRQREREGLFVVEGEDLVQAADEAGVDPVEVLRAGEDVEPELAREGVDDGVPAPRDGSLPARVAAAGRRPALALRSGTSPIRATWARSCGPRTRSAPRSHCHAGCADPTGPKALRASAGAVFRVPLAGFDEPSGKRVALVSARRRAAGSSSTRASRSRTSSEPSATVFRRTSSPPATRRRRSRSRRGRGVAQRGRGGRDRALRAPARPLDSGRGQNRRLSGRHRPARAAARTGTSAGLRSPARGSRAAHTANPPKREVLFVSKEHLRLGRRRARCDPRELDRRRRRRGAVADRPTRARGRGRVRGHDGLRSMPPHGRIAPGAARRARGEARHAGASRRERRGRRRRRDRSCSSDCANATERGQTPLQLGCPKRPVRDC